MKITLYDNHFEEDEEDLALVSDLTHKATVAALLIVYLVIFTALIVMGQWFACFVLALVGNFAYKGMRY